MELELLEARKKAAEIKLQKCRFNLQKKVQENKLTDEELFMTKELNYSNFKTLAKELADNNWKRYSLIDDIRRDIFKMNDLIKLVENYAQRIIIENAKNGVFNGFNFSSKCYEISCVFHEKYTKNSALKWLIKRNDKAFEIIRNEFNLSENIEVIYLMRQNPTKIVQFYKSAYAF